jgi:hypothetical protein
MTIPLGYSCMMKCLIVNNDRTKIKISIQNSGNNNTSSHIIILMLFCDNMTQCNSRLRCSSASTNVA